MLRILAYLFVVTMMFATGLRVMSGGIGAVLKDRGLLARSLAANIVLVPALGWFICRIIPMAADVSLGLFLLSLIPGAPFAIQFGAKSEAAAVFAGVLAFVLSTAAIVIAPLAVAALAPSAGARLPVARLIAIVALAQLAPLLAGAAVHRRSSGIAMRLSRFFGIVATIIFIAIVILTMGVKSAAVRSLGAGEVLAMALLISGSFVIGWFLGGPGIGCRQVLAMHTSFRNVALCLVCAAYVFPGRGVDAAIVAFSALVVPANFIFLACSKRK